MNSVDLLQVHSSQLRPEPMPEQRKRSTKGRLETRHDDLLRGTVSRQGTERPVCTVGSRGGLVRPRTPESCPASHQTPCQKGQTFPE
jgi:hypothetical protein